MNALVGNRRGSLRKLNKLLKRNPFDSLILDGMFDRKRTFKGRMKPQGKPRGGGGGKGF